LKLVDLVVNGPKAAVIRSIDAAASLKQLAGACRAGADMHRHPQHRCCGLIEAPTAPS